MSLSTTLTKSLLTVAICGILAGCGGAPTPLSTVFIGDSITLKWDLAALVPGTINSGVGAQTCEDMHERFQRDVLAYHPVIVFILSGTNDIRYNLSADQTPLFAMVQEAESAGAKVIVGELPPNTGWPIYTDNYPEIGQALYEQWNAGVNDGADQYGYSVADYYDPMVLANGQQNSRLFESDGTHPNAAGYAVMWSALQPVLDLVATHLNGP